MQPAEIATRITPAKFEKVFVCPDCKLTWHSSYSHVKPGETWGPWYCRHCGCGVRGKVTEEGTDIEVVDDKKTKTLVLLRLDEDVTPPIHLLIEGFVHCPRGVDPKDYIESEEYISHMRYYYNEGTCPWNYLRLPIRQGEDTDPHGIFTYQETVLWPEGLTEIDGHGEDQWGLFKTLGQESKFVTRVRDEDFLDDPA